MNEGLIVACLIFAVVVIAFVCCFAIATVDKKRRKNEPTGTINLIVNPKDPDAAPDFYLSFEDEDEYHAFLNSGNVATVNVVVKEVS